MIVFPDMIAEAAKKAGMKVPPDVDNFDAEEYPHFQVYCNVQLGVPITWGNHWTNAEIIAKIPENKIKATSLNDLYKLGFSP